MPDLSRRRFLTGTAAATGAVLLGGSSSLVVLQSAGAQAAPPTAPRLAHGPDPARSMWLSWSTPGAVSGALAEVGVDDAYGRSVDIQTTAVAGHDGVEYHHALIDGLDPGTTYRWRLRHDGADPVVGTLSTAPLDRTPFRFVTFGDQGDSGRARSIDQVVAALDPAPVLAFLVGDLSYASTSGGTSSSGTPNHRVWDNWLGLISDAGAASVPWLGGVGNHEIENGQGELGYDGYLARLALPGNGPTGVPTAWTSRYANVAFVNLDGNDASFEIARNRDWTGGAQDAWLDATLGALRADPGVDWIVVGFHHCVYCSNAVHASDGGIRQRWEGLFDRHAVDLVVNGHNHCYERSHPMRSGQIVEEVGRGGHWDSTRGTTYITAGGGGQVGYPAFLAPISTVTMEHGIRLPELALWSAFRYPSNSLAYVDVDPGVDGGVTSMKVVPLDAEGRALETVTLVRPRAAGAPEQPPTTTTTAPASPTTTTVPTTTAPRSNGSLPTTGRDDAAKAAVAAAALGAAVATRLVSREPGR